jgi:uncharacterized protein
MDTFLRVRFQFQISIRLKAIASVIVLAIASVIATTVAAVTAKAGHKILSDTFLYYYYHIGEYIIMIFKIFATSPTYDEFGDILEMSQKIYHYNNHTSEILDHLMKPIETTPQVRQTYSTTPFPAVSKNTPLTKNNIETLKIQLGLSCNYSCEYCSQRFVPHVDESNNKYVTKFIDNLDKWIETPPKEIEFWGGEPFVYYKIMKPLAEALRKKYPDARFLVITNGSMITDDISDWLYEMDFRVGLSHDGPGQVVRGPDPFDDLEQREILLRFIKRFSDARRFSINSMIHRENLSRSEIVDHFQNLFGDDFNFGIGEGSFIDTYDEGGEANALQSAEEHYAFRNLTMMELMGEKINRFHVTRQRISEWINSFGNKRPSHVLGQKCGMDDPQTIAVDLRGNVLTCQNVSAVSTAPNKNPHLIGHVSKLENVKLNTATHWKFRKDCNDCPLLQMCKGSCMFLEGEHFKISCDSAYSDHLPFFATAFEKVTGCLPYRIEPIEGHLPEERQDLWGSSEKEYAAPRRRKL